jgi:hypothetical protein
MFRLSESDYRKLEPIALKVYRGSAKSVHVAQLMESKVGRRALVDMMFLEDKEEDLELMKSAFLQITDEEFKAIKERLQMAVKVLKDFENKSNTTNTTNQEPLTKAEKESFFTKVKNFFLKIYNWIKKIFKKGWEKIKSFFTWLYSLFFKEANFKSPRWLNIAIAVAVVIAIGYFLFGTKTGEKVRSFILNAIKGGLGAIKSAIKYVLGKSNAPQEIKNETESFLDEATA